MPRAGRDEDRIAGADLARGSVDFHLCRSLEKKINFLAHPVVVALRESSRRKSGLGEALVADRRVGMVEDFADRRTVLCHKGGLLGNVAEDHAARLRDRRDFPTPRNFRKKSRNFSRTAEFNAPNMKTRLFLLLAAATLASGVTSQAQTPAPSPAPSSSGKPDGHRHRFERMAESLPEDIRDRFRQLHEEALQDPKIQELRAKAEAAGKEFREAMREAMSKRDPELAEKVRSHFEKRWKKDGDAKPWKQKIEEAVKSLPPEEKDRFEKAREIAKQAPAVQEAEAKLKAAQSPEERREARKEFHEAMRAAMLTADPSLADVLDKVRPEKPAGPPEEGQP